MKSVFGRNVVGRWLSAAFIGATLLVAGRAWAQGEDGGRPPAGPADAPPPQRNVRTRTTIAVNRRRPGRKGGAPVAGDAKNDAPRGGPEDRPAPPPPRDGDAQGDDQVRPRRREGPMSGVRPMGKTTARRPRRAS